MTRHFTVRGRPSAATMLHLEGTYARPPSHLSFSANLALEYAQAWLVRAGRLKVPAAGVLRRALELYAAHLATAEPGHEFAAVRAACQATIPDEGQRQEAELRLHTVPPDEPLPSFRDVQRSPAARRAMEKLTADAEALAETVLAQMQRPKRADSAM